MTTLFRSRQRAEDFAALVDGTRDEGRGADAATQALAGVAQLLRAYGRDTVAAVPREDFAADLRERLLAEAATVLIPANAGLVLPARTRTKRERRWVAVASATVLLGGTAGMAAAAQNALPGEALYPVKRGIEKAEAGLSLSSAGRGRDLLHQASDRLVETRGLLDRGAVTGVPQVPTTLAAFTSQAEQGADLLLASYADSRDPATIRAVRDFTASALRDVEALSRTAPPEARPGLRQAAFTLHDIDARATRLCLTCSDLPVLEVPSMFLASAEADRALRGLDVAGLDNSHPVVADKQQLRAAAPNTGRRGAGNTQQGSGAGATAPHGPAAPPAAPDAGAPLPGGLPASPPTPKVKVKVNGDLKGNPSDGLTGGLGGTAETLLPDPVTDLLP